MNGKIQIFGYRRWIAGKNSIARHGCKPKRGCGWPRRQNKLLTARLRRDHPLPLPKALKTRYGPKILKRPAPAFQRLNKRRYRNEGEYAPYAKNGAAAQLGKHDV
ncbi:hypothetical protein [Yoonia sediminilitoris]|uniref:hypothetical protein n=1 Tax=Yoonia sediminilitoris TaxID=1286148 RepID=UPI000D36BE96|nr:hypothetical protein [Yoonia sediminilitoris]